MVYGYHACLLETRIVLEVLSRHFQSVEEDVESERQFEALGVFTSMFLSPGRCSDS